MGKFCTSCGSALNEGDKFCKSCGRNIAEINKTAQVNTKKQKDAENKADNSAAMNSGKEEPTKAKAFNDAFSQTPKNVGQFIREYINKSLEILKNPKQMLPTIVLGLVWLLLSLLRSFGFNPFPVRLLSFITFAQGGMFGGFFGAVGGILGKVVVAAFLNAAIVPLFQKKAPFSGLSGGVKGFFGGLAIDSLSALAPLIGGVGASLLLYAFMSGNQSLQNSMVGIIAFVMLLQSLGRRGGFFWGLAFSAASSLTKGRTPAYIGVTRCITGITLGFAIGVALSAIGLRWCVWLGMLLLAAALILRIVSKKKKGVARV